jgi:long-chain acyl-CoA synthetase
MIDESAYLADVAARQLRNWPASVPRTELKPFGDMPLGEMLSEWARLQPDKTAIVYYGREISYAELDRLSDRFAALLASRGIGKGDHVAVFMQNCPQFHIVFFGLMKLGAVHVPVNPMFKQIELAYELKDSAARALVALDQLYDLVQEVRGQTGVELIFTTSLGDMLPDQPTLPLPPMVTEAKRACPGSVDLMDALAAVTAAPPVVEIDLDALAALNYTGGTTGMPKGCVHTQRDMLYTAATGMPMVVGIGHDSITLCFMPLFWIAGEDMGLIFPIYAGATLVLLARWDALAYMTAVDHYKVNHTYLLTDNAIEVLEHPDVGRFNLRSIVTTKVTSFVKKLNAEFRVGWRKLTGSTAHEASWGMTETHTFDTFTTGMADDDFDLRQLPIFVGLPVPGTEFKICDFETGALLPLGEHGEIRVRSPSLLKAYWNKDEATTENLVDGWLRTGDIGVIDEGGYVHYLGRRKEMLKVRGMSVFPGEVETMLAQHPAVLGSGIVGRPDADKGEVPVAFIALKAEYRDTLSEAELTAWCRANMAGYKVPEMRFIDALPLTATGKVAKEELKKLV